MKKLFLPLLSAVLLAAALVACEKDGEPISDSKLPDAADFTLSTIDGSKKVSLSDFRGKPVVLNFWASWCGPCKEEIPLFEKTWQEYEAKGVVFIGVDVMDDKKNAEKFVESEGVTYLNLHDPSGDASSKYGVVALPATFFINRDGQIIRQNYGPFVGEEGEKQFKKILSEMSK